MLVNCWPTLFYCLAFIVRFHLITCEGRRISISWSSVNLTSRNWWQAQNQVGHTLHEENIESSPDGYPKTTTSILNNADFERLVRGVNLLDLLPKNSGGATVIGNRHHVDIVDDRPIWGDSTVQVQGLIQNFNDKTEPKSTEYPNVERSTETEVVTSFDFKPVVKLMSSPSKQPNEKELPAKLSDAITPDEKNLQDEPADERESLLPFLNFLPNQSLKYCCIYCKYPLDIPAVSGGIDAQLHEFPHMATLGYGSDEARGKYSSWNTCGATLISKNFVLTAAHCTDSSWGPPTVVRVGEHDLSRQDEGADPKDYKVIKVIVHPDYVVDHSSLYNDIALLQLAKSVKFTEHLRPACLHNGVFLDGQQSRELKTAVATGWGNTGFVDAPSDVLQKVTLDLIKNEECKKYVNPGPYIPTGIVDSQMCAGILTGGKDTCVGDSGGPLQVNNTAFHPIRVCPKEIIGITSFGTFCGQAESPGVYTRVAPFVPWIESIVWPTL